MAFAACCPPYAAVYCKLITGNRESCSSSLDGFQEAELPLPLPLAPRWRREAPRAAPIARRGTTSSHLFATNMAAACCTASLSARLGATRALAQRPAGE